ncbi:hypothetical protein AB4037_23310 [Labrys sp. KB_33_2]|uniref:hypothetical protein n=1 Tax=Labrys sp. KB_33_2 TaxID=3237479 RepID=UPI003F934BA1
MTSEVCLMNRLAVVLAADSATTVTRWTENGKEERYFKGANKIFQLSNYQPVGLMIYDSADILSVPWEVVVKEFRSVLGERSFNHIQEYAEEFFNFIDTSLWLFPVAVQREHIIDQASSAGFRLLFGLDLEGLPDDAEKAAVVRTAVNERAENLAKLPLIPRIDQDAANDLLASSKDEVAQRVRSWLGSLDLDYVDCLEAIAENGINELLKNPHHFLGCTGLVFAGFGEKDPFPTMIEFQSCGIVAGKFAAREQSHMSIDHSTPAWISAFAQTAMSDTFTLGLSKDIYGSLVGAVADGLNQFAQTVTQESGGDLNRISNIEDLIVKTTDSIGEAVLQQARRDHAAPLRNILGVLPVDEMAELAETLINLQSLKEKVTKPSETVGGPVDVAIVTRGEGLVWIKRKHFFPRDLNARYLAKLNSVYD